MGFTSFLDRLGREYLRQERERLTGKTAEEEELMKLAPEMRRAQIAELKARPDLAEQRLEAARQNVESLGRHRESLEAIARLRAEIAGQPKPPEPYTLGPGQVRYGLKGEVLARGPAERPAVHMVPGTAPTGGTFVQGEGGVFFNPKTGQLVTPPEGFKPKPPAALLTQKAAEEGVRTMIGGETDATTGADTIWGLAARINTHGGIVGRGVGLLRRGSAAAGEDPDVQVYQDQLAGMASRLAKAFGESGRLSDQDIQRTVNMFPRVGDSPEVTKRKMARVSSLISSLGDDPAQNALLVNQATMDVIRGKGPENQAVPTGGLDPEVERRLKALGY